ncbi:hypothetical protein IE4771_PB00359 (plasmid) [Rhizobium etli bv. mimosae str. IE4771]|uniref:Uncharacterized protein n=1 Tax=Rhizobium etli bv. mimosae str. IE4771 TaxID=1432050 RepID=A0A060IDK4_RHIET|nr:hypothetical protein IE4771_PB00359 [Rhizobium sp. IE4771]
MAGRRRYSHQTGDHQYESVPQDRFMSLVRRLAPWRRELDETVYDGYTLSIASSRRSTADREAGCPWQGQKRRLKTGRG